MRLLLLLFTACASSTPAPAELASPPFTADQIRGATKVGRTYTWRVRSEGRSLLRKLVFTAVSDTEAITEAKNLTEEGAQIGEPQRSTTTWEGFVKHASWPADSTRITDERITVEAGEFDCMLYTVSEQKDGKSIHTRAWFARELPGAPVRMIVHIDGSEAMNLELIEHQSGN
jgi:hypothetical protein